MLGDSDKEDVPNSFENDLNLEIINIKPVYYLILLTDSNHQLL
jgi:hypothetical protein